MTTLTIYKGDAATFTETITGLDSLAGYEAKMYITTQLGVAIATLEGSITDLVITYQLVNETTKAFTPGGHKYETKIWDASDHVYTPHESAFQVLDVINSDPS